MHYEDDDRPRSAPSTTSNLPGLLVIGIGIMLLAGGAYYLWKQQSHQTEPAVTPLPIEFEVKTPSVEAPVAEVEESPPLFEEKAPREIVLPPATLEGSDAFVKKAIQDLAPAMAEWLISTQQIRKWVLVMDLMADGSLMKQDRPLKYPMDIFRANPAGDEQFVPLTENHGRTTLLIDTITAIDPELLMYYYGKWSPLLEKAYQELGKKGSFHGRVKKSMDRLLAVQPLAAEPLLEKKGGVMYRYVDPQLEAASDVEKMLWRMGPDNSVKLQAWLKKVQEQMPK